MSSSMNRCPACLTRVDSMKMQDEWLAKGEDIFTSQCQFCRTILDVEVHLVPSYEMTDQSASGRRIVIPPTRPD